MTVNGQQIIERLDAAITNVQWKHAPTFDYRHFNQSQGRSSGSYIASMQQFRFSASDNLDPIVSKASFFSALPELKPATTLAAIDHPTYIELRIFNFFPPVVKAVGSLFGRKSYIQVFIKPDSPAIAALSEDVTDPNVSLWGYEFLKKRGLPKLFLSGPGLFDFSLQLYRTHLDERLLSLIFIASERPNALMNIFGKDRLFPHIKRISQSSSPFAGIANRFVITAENSMLDIHNRVHRQLIQSFIQ